MISNEPLTVRNLIECRIGADHVALGYPNLAEYPDLLALAGMMPTSLLVVVTNSGVRPSTQPADSPRAAYRLYRWQVRRLQRQLVGAMIG